MKLQDLKVNNQSKLYYSSNPLLSNFDITNFTSVTLNTIQVNFCVAWSRFFSTEVFLSHLFLQNDLPKFIFNNNGQKHNKYFI
jgi:hypothetical protein